MKNIQSNSGKARRLVAILAAAAMLAAPLTASAGPRHAPPPTPYRHGAPSRMEYRHPAPPPHFHGEYRHRMPPPPPPHHRDHHHHDSSDAATGVAVAVGAIAAVGLIAAICAD